MMLSVSPISASSRFVLAIALASACRSTASTPPATPATPSPGPAAPETPRARSPEDVVATVDGAVIREADVARRERMYSTTPETPVPARNEIVLQLVERRLVAARVARLDMAHTGEVVDRVLADLAASNGMTVEQLRAAVEGAGAITWDEYRDEIGAQFDEGRLLFTQPRMSTPDWYTASTVTDAERLAARTRMLGCLRAGAEISLADASVELPANPFGNAATFAGVRFTGDTGVPVAEIEAAAKAAGGSAPVCEAVVDVEHALAWFLADHGYLDAVVRTTWPTGTGAVTLDVQTEPGPRYLVGAIRLDQASVSKATRLADKALRRRIAAIAKPGDLARASKLREVLEIVAAAAGERSLAVEPTLERRPAPAGKDASVDLVLRLTTRAG